MPEYCKADRVMFREAGNMTNIMKISAVLRDENEMTGG